MPIDDLAALGQKMKIARKEKELTQQELADLSHVSIKQIAKIEKGKINPSYLILKALAKVLSISLDSLINPNVSPEDEGINQMKMFYSSCPLEMRKTLLRLTQETTRELTELSKNFDMYPLYWTTSKEGIFICDILMNISVNVLNHISRGSCLRYQKVSLRKGSKE